VRKERKVTIRERRNREIEKCEKGERENGERESEKGDLRVPLPTRVTKAQCHKTF